MRTWNGTILGPPGTVHENRIYSLRLFCDHSYPDRPPAVRFESKVNLTCVKCARRAAPHASARTNPTFPFPLTAPRS